MSVISRALSHYERGNVLEKENPAVVKLDAPSKDEDPDNAISIQSSTTLEVGQEVGVSRAEVCLECHPFL
jgi:hypothetical protein